MPQENAFSKLNSILVIVAIVLTGALAGLGVSLMHKQVQKGQLLGVRDPAQNTVKMAGNEVAIVTGIFGTTEIHTRPGTPILWSNRDTNPITLISQNNLFAEQIIEGEKSFSFAISRPGEYFFTVKGTQSMLRVIVE